MDRDRIGGEEGKAGGGQLKGGGHVSRWPPHESFSLTGPEAGNMSSQMSARVLPLPGHRGFRLSLPNPASRGGPSVSPHIRAPAAFPAGGAVGTKGRCMHRMGELHRDKPHKAGTLPRRRSVKLEAPLPVPQRLPWNLEAGVSVGELRRLKA